MYTQRHLCDRVYSTQTVCIVILSTVCTDRITMHTVYTQSCTHQLVTALSQWHAITVLYSSTNNDVLHARSHCSRYICKVALEACNASSYCIHVIRNIKGRMGAPFGVQFEAAVLFCSAILVLPSPHACCNNDLTIQRVNACGIAHRSCLLCSVAAVGHHVALHVRVRGHAHCPWSPRHGQAS